ncbi:hypothetical protein [Segatella sp.]|uniref:hypothetical protein n=1 Tax=Segatella sp. TaxID=2974253 RepID=UPI00257EB622
MKHLNKLASVFCMAAMGLTALTGCEGSDMFSVNGPDWLSEKIDSIANSNKGTAPTISPTTLGATDNSDTWWTSHLDADIKIESNKSYSTTFTNYTSGANNYNNYVVVLRKADKTEYCCLRSDDYGWGDSFASCTHSNSASADWGAWLAQMNGAKVTVTVTNYGDNTADVVAEVTGTEGLTSTQKYLGIPVESADLYLDFTTDGCHYVFDKAEMDVADLKDQQPESMELINVPAEVDKGTSVKDFTSTLKAKVTYSDGAIKDVDASDLEFVVVPDMETVGEKYVVATLKKTLLGKTADKTISANAKFSVVAGIKSITITKAPEHTHYYFFNSSAFASADRTLAFDPTGMEVTAKYVEGEDAVLDNSKLTFSAIPATAGEHEVTITTENGRKTTVKVNVAESKLVAANPTPSVVGATDNSSAFWTEFSDDIKVPAGKTLEYGFTNYTDAALNYHNFCVILRNASLTEYVVVRADNYGWTYDNSGPYGYKDCTPSGGQTDWAAWLAAMNGAKCKVYITNNNNGRADIQITMLGNDGVTYTQSYWGISGIDVNDLQSALTVENAHIVFGSAAARKHYTRAHRR